MRGVAKESLKKQAARYHLEEYDEEMQKAILLQLKKGHGEESWLLYYVQCLPSAVWDILWDTIIWLTGQAVSLRLCLN